AEALAELKRDHASYLALRLAFEDMLRWRQPELGRQIIDLLESVGDDTAVAILSYQTMMGHPQSGLMRAAIERIRQAQIAASTIGQIVDEAKGLEKDGAIAELLASARKALAQLEDASGLTERLRREVISDHIRDLEAAADPVARAVIARHLREHLEAAGYRSAAPGSNAVPLPGKARAPGSFNGRVQALRAGAFLTAGLAGILGIVLPLLALWPIAPAAAVVSAASWSLASGWSWFQKFDADSADIEKAPRRQTDKVPEFQPMYQAMSEIMARLGVAPTLAPRIGLYLTGGAFNAYSIGRGLGPDAVVAVGEGLLSEPPHILKAVVAHEIAHIVNKDHIGLAYWRRLHILARNAGIIAITSALCLTPIAGIPVFLPLAAGGALWSLSSLLGRAWSRAAELRADRFAARIAGSQAMRDAIGLWRGLGLGGGGLFSTHPSLDQREANVRP
ncbi:MAG: M48 family metalloprotease, partial [Elusimicrobiota bacterium]